MRNGWIIAANLVVPGAGLIALRRHWLGLCLALLFCVLAQLAVVGVLLLPASIPGWASWSAAVGASAVWAWAQWLAATRFAKINDVDTVRELATLLERIDEAVQRGELEDAVDLIAAALDIDDEAASLYRRRAEVLTRLGRTHAAAVAWRRVLQLDRNPAARDEARDSLARISGRAR